MSGIKPFYGIAPVAMGRESDEIFIQRLRDIHANYHIAQFLLIPPQGFVAGNPIPSTEYCHKVGQRMNQIKCALQPEGIAVGVWCAPTFKAGHSDTCVPVTNIDGQTAIRTYCPLDETWTQQVINNMTAIVAEMHPFMLLLEDDYELSNQDAVRFGCFCDLHLKKFAEQCHHEYSRADLLREFTQGNVELRRQWGKLSKATLVDFAQKLRTAVDQVSPETRIGLCQPGCSRFDGDFDLEVCRALAGKRHRPFIRVGGSTYSSDAGFDLIEEQCFMKHFMDSFPADLEIVHETDCYPHNTFFVSARKLDALLTAAVSYGAKGSLYYGTQYLDNPSEETAYFKRWKNNLPKYQLMAELIERQAAPVSFCRTTYCPDNSCGIKYDGQHRPHSFPNPWLSILGRYGFDVTYWKPEQATANEVIFVDVQDLQVMSHAEILELLTHKIVLDGAGALYLTQQGLAQYLGVTAQVNTQAVKFVFERILPPYRTALIPGEFMYNLISHPAGQEGGGFVHLTELAADTQIITDFVGSDVQCTRYEIGMTKFENELGGQVLITAYDIQSNVSSSIYNFRKQELMASLVEKMSGQIMPFRVQHANVFTILRRSAQDNKFYATLIALGTDTLEAIKCRFAQKPGQIRLLNPDGLWRDLAYAQNHLNLKLDRLDAQFLEITF